jgi:hypothetical protein
VTASVVQWPEFLATDPEDRVRFPALPDFLRSSGSGTGSTQPREYNGVTCVAKEWWVSSEVRTGFLYILRVLRKKWPPLWSGGQSSLILGVCILLRLRDEVSCVTLRRRIKTSITWSEFLATDPEVRFRFPELPDFLRSSGSETGSTQPRDYNWGAAWKKN